MLYNCLPCGLQSWNGSVPEPGDDGEHWVEVVGLLTLPRHLDKLFDNSHSFRGIWLRYNFTYCPHHFAIYLQKQEWLKPVSLTASFLGFASNWKRLNFGLHVKIYRRFSRSKQLGGLVPVLWLGVPLRCKASKLWFPLKIPPLYKKRTLFWQ